jgi:hypothetical protein
MSDPASTYTRLRAETAAMLGVDPADMSKTEGLRLDITSLLLLEIDSLQGSILANEKVDLARLASALTMLQKLLPEQALVAPAAAADQADPFSGAVAELDALLSQRAFALERRREREAAEMAANPAKACAELEMKIQAAIEKYGTGKSEACFGFEGNTIPDPGGGEVQSRDVAHPSLPRAPAVARGEHPLLIEPPPAQQQPPKRVETDEEKMARVNATPVPAHYLKQDSPWRRHLDADGNIVAPYFNPHG